MDVEYIRNRETERLERIQAQRTEINQRRKRTIWKWVKRLLIAVTVVGVLYLGIRYGYKFIASKVGGLGSKISGGIGGIGSNIAASPFNPMNIMNPSTLTNIMPKGFNIMPQKLFTPTLPKNIIKLPKRKKIKIGGLKL